MGNVKSIWQQINGMPELKQTNYQFELSSGKTMAVLYQDGKSDAFYHQYEYDAENRIKSVYTNTQKTTSAGLLSIINAPGTVKDAAYQYYKHGPLSRTELGGNLQGLDYSYTIHGWLKALNGQDLNPLKEMGRDGEPGSGIHSGFSRDVLAYSLGYFIGDYAPINGSGYIRPYTYNGISGLRGVPIYNGNINYATYANKGLGDSAFITAHLYSYHQLYTLAGKHFHEIPSTSTSWHDNTGLKIKYRESIGKDINGNITRIVRNGDQNIDSYKMDELTLHYNGNKLDWVDETYTNSNYPNDIEGQATLNYKYDKIGNLISDVQEGIIGIFWNVYGKIREIRKGSTVIKYRYDAAGNRVYKEESGPGGINATWYVRDVQGNVLSTYEGILTQTIKESYIYGSSRLGSYIWNSGGGTPSRSYEISNYLGNVMATIGDGQIPRMNGSLIDYYDADIQTATDYYSYGMVMPGRSFNAGSYRYGFNGQEMSNEIKGVGNSYTAEFWEYDPRLGRRWNLDPRPITGVSEYATFNNNPIVFMDPFGDTLRAVNSSSATMQLNLIQDMFKNDKAVKRLFKLGSDGLTFSTIDQYDFDNAIVDLDIDKQNAAIALLESINSKSTQYVSYVSGNDFPNKDLATVAGLDPRLARSVAVNAPSMSVLNTNFGGAMNSYVDRQSLSIINSSNSFSPLDIYDSKGSNINYAIPLGAVFFHEALGHGLGGILKSTNQKHIDAIQLENVYYRAMGVGVQREGSDHGPIATSLSPSVRSSVPAFIQGRRLFTIDDDSFPDFIKTGATRIERQ